METDGSAEPTGGHSAEASKESISGFRDAKRASMARTLERMLKIAKREARGKTLPGTMRLKWVNTVAYLTQTYNNLLRDTEVNELQGQLNVLMERVKKLSGSKHQQS